MQTRVCSFSGWRLLNRAALSVLLLLLFVPFLRAQYAPEGITIAGGNASGPNPNQLRFPTGAGLDGQGNLYIADQGNHRIQKWAPGASQGITVAGGNGAGAGASQLNSPTDVMIDGQGNLYIADQFNNRIQKWAPGASQGITVAGGNGAGAGANQLNSPTDVMMDGQGNLYIADYFNHRVQKWTPGASEGITVAGGNGQGPGSTQLNYPTNVMMDGQGNLYIADQGNHRIQKWAPGASQGITVAGGNGQGPGSTQLNFPTDVMMDGQGNLYIADQWNYRIQKWAPGASQGITVAGGNGQGRSPDQLGTLRGLDFDSQENLYVSDYSNHRIQKFVLQVVITHQPPAGSVVCAGSSVTTAVAVSRPQADFIYRWYKDNQAIPLAGQTSATLSLTNVQAADAGSYRVVITGLGNSVTSDAFQLTVDPLPGAFLTVSGVITCANPTVTVTAPAIDGATYSFSNGATQINGGNTATVSTAGTYSVVVTTSTGCSATASIAVTGGCAAPVAPLSVLHQDADYNQPANNIIRPYLQLLNEGTTAVPYGEITVRYWLTAENFSLLTNLSVYWAQLGTDKVKMKYVELPQPRQGAFGYIEYRFEASAGSLAPGANSGPIQTGIGKQDWTAFSETDDYSYAAHSNYTKNLKITVYRNGVLVGGQEPSEIVPVQRLRVYSESKSSTTTNSISTYIQLRNEGNVPVNYQDLRVRYYFTTEGSQPLNFYLDYAQLGNGKVKGTLIKLTTPVAGADHYLELSFTGLDKLYPLAGTGSIQYRLAKADWSNFNQTNDHSYNAPGSMAENPKMVVYLNGTNVYGTEPAGANARLAATAEQSELEVTVLGNPVQGDQLEFEVKGAAGQPLWLRLIDRQGKIVSERQVMPYQTTGRYQLSIVNQPAGLFLLRVNTSHQVKTSKVVKAY